MPSKNAVNAVIFVAVITSLTESFHHHLSIHLEATGGGARTGRRVESRARRSSSSSSSSHASGHSDGCEFCNATAFSGPIHVSRRKFIRLSTAATTITGSLSSSHACPAHAIDDPDSIFAPYQKNIIAIGGPLPPFSTTRAYRNIVLSNGLKVVLVKDSLVQRSSVALSIDGAGQFSEPEDIPGLAHLMEHIVLSSTRFSGKQKILERKARKLWNSDQGRNDIISTGEEAFEDWLTDNDGNSNAFTAPGFVCFHFNCPHEVSSF
jgi:hypothetical protein